MDAKIKNLVERASRSEKSIENYLTKQVSAIGGLCLKYTNGNITGYPDRIVLIPGGWTRWVEIKSKGKHPTRLQQERHKELEAVGQTVHVIDSREEVDALINIWKLLIL